MLKWGTKRFWKWDFSADGSHLLAANKWLICWWTCRGTSVQRIPKISVSTNYFSSCQLVLLVQTKAFCWAPSRPSPAMHESEWEEELWGRKPREILCYSVHPLLFCAVVRRALAVPEGAVRIQPVYNFRRNFCNTILKGHYPFGLDYINSTKGFP